MSLTKKFTAVAAAGILTLSLAGCGGSEADEIAGEACDLLKDTLTIMDDTAMDTDTATDRLMEIQGKYEALQARAEKADLSDDEMEKAVKDKCPDVANAVSDM